MLVSHFKLELLSAMLYIEKDFWNVLVVGIFVFTGDHRNSIYIDTSSFVFDNYVSSHRFPMVTLQSILKIPVWWVWGYWICPLAWSLKGALTSQYGDVEKEIVVHGEQRTISAFLGSIYGYNYDDLGVVAIRR
ncbi:pleiotropic drug resistance protein 3 [Prunus yedoensis var. nudiflora]|uniref:Pleiotropic drug resistance protein 3 n=1 Tax=Prunus yedoensis var. nudiflora TaxID=2094558 RepID=A0A314YJF9_PRUYE|nr:pleiotropic drug resistance protein 3 [Prunus yedoensis var. nudiflora]